MISEFTHEYPAVELSNGKEIYYRQPAQTCRVGIVSRRRITSGPDGKDIELPPETEAAFILNGGAWLPAVFSSVSTFQNSTADGSDDL